MILFITLAILCGMLSGVFTGLVPGVHVNLLTIMVVGLAATTPIAPLLLATFIISLAVTHSFLATIPSVYLGAPEESTSVAVLPGHQLFLKGKGHLAVIYTLIGSQGGLLLTLLALPLFYRFLPSLQVFLEPYIGKILLGMVILLLTFSGKFFTNMIFFLVAGVLGFLTFRLTHQTQILLPLLSGLFGTSTLLYSLTTVSAIPWQKLNRRHIPLKRRDSEGSLLRGTAFGIFASFFPGLGASQAALFASMTKKRASPEFYLLLVGCISTVNFVFSLLTLTLLSKARNGAVLGVMELLGEIAVMDLLLYCCVMLISGSLSVILGIHLSRQFAHALARIPYRTTLLAVIILITVLVLVFSGLQGIIILATATALGILAQHFGAQKNMLLGCLLIPVMSYLW